MDGLRGRARWASAQSQPEHQLHNLQFTAWEQFKRKVVQIIPVVYNDSRLLQPGAQGCGVRTAGWTEGRRREEHCRNSLNSAPVLRIPSQAQEVPGKGALWSVTVRTQLTPAGQALTLDAGPSTAPVSPWMF